LLRGWGGVVLTGGGGGSVEGIVYLCLPGACISI
jgi:hypothetical protein